MSFVLSTIALTLLLTFHVTSGSDDVDIKRKDCFRDICVSRRQFCSTREQRCKYCRPAHCVDPEKTPADCRPLCPELLATSTTASTTITTTPTTKSAATTTVKSSPRQTPPGQNIPIPSGNPNKADAQEDGIFPYSWKVQTEFVLLLVFLALVVLMALGIANLIYTIRLSRSQRPRPPPSPRDRRMDVMEEGQALLGGEWGSKSSNRTVGSVSHSTKSSPASKHVPVSSETRPQAHQSTRSVDQLNYTARTPSQLHLTNSHSGTVAPTSPDEGATGDSLRHHKGCDYRLLDQTSGQMAEHAHHGPAPLALSPVPPYSSTSRVGMAGHVSEETCPKSL